MELTSRFVYNTPLPGSLPEQPSILIEGHGDNWGVCVPMDGLELQYFSRQEMQMLAYAILALINDG